MVAIAAYPKQLTDPVWKKVESKGGVSSTGVGKLLRDAEAVYKTFGAQMAKVGNEGEGAKSVGTAKVKAATAVDKAAKAVHAVAAKQKDAKKKKLLDVYSMYAANIATELTNFDFESHHGFDYAFKRYNERIVMWNKWVMDQAGLK